ncbi:MAG TPA: hypothetical protein VN408_33335 [Actinoplanes sp.]|nr:hypothetical protein [Actinoplanes sp.]
MSDDADLCTELDRLIFEDECFDSEGFAALPALSRMAQSGNAEQRERALDLAGVITRTLHRHYADDGLVRASPEAFAALHRVARAHVSNRKRLQDTLAFAGYTFWASISMDFTDEHYHLGCPQCATQLAIVIGEYGCYAAFRHYTDGDINRVPLMPAAPTELTGIRRWAHDTAMAIGDPVLAAGLAHLFGRARCGLCGCSFDLADWFEAENSPGQPIDPVVPRRPAM